VKSKEIVDRIEKEEANKRTKSAESRLAEAEKSIFLLEKCVEDYCPEIGLTYTFRQYFYEILGHHPEWIEPPKNTAHFELWRDEVLKQKGDAEK